MMQIRVQPGRRCLAGVAESPGIYLCPSLFDPTKGVVEHDNGLINRWPFDRIVSEEK
jgi:hypothetical protein